ncbi:uncharacterized protein LOC115620705 isoform X2 [Scaptodrosophila lebanonensis]|uniref:Uncharacterized protein LOC115620705 isoform X2 n=1 Tax=Drosophila lebanonensis TaxID=7225 RepID=A0A6J2T3X7_DROLE|nr:uncharacterized protein LOC115620705 isoform X2 [Scaptodrosophila lebanonensis]
MCRRAVRDWLVQLTMEKYIYNIADKGFDTIARSHRKLLMDGVHLLRNSAEHFICTEPCELHSDELNMDLFNPAEELDSKGSCDSIFINSDFATDEVMESSPHPSPPLVPKSKSLPKMKSQLWADTDELVFPSKHPTILKSKSLPKFGKCQNPDNGEVIIKSTQTNVPTLRVTLSYVCAACPHLKFSTKSALEQHIAENNGTESIDHKRGVPLVNKIEKVALELIEID